MRTNSSRSSLAPWTRISKRAVGHLQHARHHARHAHPIEVVRAGLLDLGVARGDHHEHAVAGEHVVDQRDRALLPDRERGERFRERHAVPQREDLAAAGQRGRDGRLRGLAIGGGDVDGHLWALRAVLDRDPPHGLVGPASGIQPRGCRPRTTRWRRRPRPRRRTRRGGGRGRVRSRSAGRGGRCRRSAPLAGDQELPAADLERHVLDVDPGQLRLDDRAGGSSA